MLHYNFFFEKSVGLWRIIYWIHMSIFVLHIILIDDLTNQPLSIKTLNKRTMIGLYVYVLFFLK